MRTKWLCLLVVLGLVGFAATTFADSEMLDRRDRTVDWAIGGLESGSRLLRPETGREPAGTSAKTPRSAVQSSDAGGRAQPRAGGVLGIFQGGGARVTPAPGSGTGPTLGGGGQQTGTGGTGGATETTPGGGTTTTPGGETGTGTGETGGGGLRIHVDADTSTGTINVGAQTETTDTTLAVDTGTTTDVDFTGEVNAEAGSETGSTDLDASTELTDPGLADTTTQTEVSSTLTGGADDAAVNLEEAEEVGNDPDDCPDGSLSLVPCAPLF